MYYEINFSAVSNIGNVRKVNQDNLICNGQYIDLENKDADFRNSGTVNSKKTTLFGIFDGMGGEECGEVASFIATTEALNFKFGKDGVADLLKLCHNANTKICEYTKENQLSSMGTTAAMLLFDKYEITLCNIGDSKIFRLSQNDFKQISTDHVVVSVFGRKPPLSQNLGVPPEELIIEPYVSKGDYQDGDKYLICSDGLTDMVTSDEIETAIKENTLEEAVKILLEKSLENGGKDNITIILLQINKKNFFRFFQ